MTAISKYVFTITAGTDEQVSKVLINLIDQADKVKLGFEYHVSITDFDEDELLETLLDRRNARLTKLREQS